MVVCTAVWCPPSSAWKMFLDFLQEGTTFVQWFQVPKSYLLLLMGVVTVAIVLVHYLVGISQDPWEPPYVPQKLPSVGDLVGILRHGTKHYDFLTSASHLVVSAPWIGQHEGLFVVQRTLREEVWRFSMEDASADSVPGTDL